MDYLVFLTGLFLLTAGVGSLFLFREDGQLSRWPLFALALAALGLKVWFGILVFAMGVGETAILVNALLGGLFAAALLGFCLSPLIQRRRVVFVVKWAAMIACFVVTSSAGIGNLNSGGFITPIVLVAFAGGWKFVKFHAMLFGQRKSTLPLIISLLFTIIAAICLFPEAMEVCYDIHGQGNAPERIVFLIALATATAYSLEFCLILWSTIYQARRSELSRNLLHRRRLGTAFILTAAVFTCVNGAWLAHWLGEQTQKEKAATLLSALQLGANHLQSRQIEQLQGQPQEIDSPGYQALRARLLQVREALPGVRFSYILGMRDNKLVFLVDAEDPATKETFSPPGSPVEDYPQKWQPELAGRSTFSGPDRDQWGTWFAACVPILDEDHNIIALLGVDYPAAKWLQPLAARRLAAMVVTLSVVLLLIGLFSFHLISIATAKRVESLSEHLSDAMSAAGLDTWECVLQPFQLKLGERIATTLGWTGSNANPSLRKVWKQIHPQDRHQLIQLVRAQDDALPSSSEHEIRLMDASGRWLWFMLRGRAVGPDLADRRANRLVGTILDIDERHRSRLESDKQRRFAQHVMEAVPNGLAVISAEGLITYANPAFIRLARSGADDLVDKAITELVTQADSTAATSTGFEATLACMDGALVPIQVFRAALTDTHQSAGSILAIVDLTAAKEAEQNLLRSRAEANRLALVAKRTDNAVVITDTLGRIEWVNEGFTKISGYSKEEVIGQIPSSFLQHATDNPAERAYIRERIKAGLGFETEIVNHAKNGRAYIIHIEGQPLVNKHGTLTGFMAIERDVTQARRSSNLLEAVASISTTLLAKRIEPSVWGEILGALGTAANVDRCYIFRIHPHPELGTPAMSQTAEWNSGSATPQFQNPQLQNFSFHENGYGRWLPELLAGHEINGVVDDFPAAEQPMLIAQEIRSLVVVPIFTGDQLTGFMGFDACQEDRVWEHWEISILRSAAANIGLRQVVQNEADALLIARDEARSAALTAEAANRAKSTFLATMSHEIRTPLNAVIGMASLLETTPLNAQQQDFTETILNSSNFLLELITDILDYSRIESGNIELDSAPFNLADLCRDAFDVVRPAAMGKPLELIARLAPQLPLMIEGDRSRISQILINLLNNAVKFTPSGFVSLMVDGQRAAADGLWQLVFEVKDSGIGIAPDAIMRLFNPFIQADSSTTRCYGGSGLGLAISQRLAKCMDGDITVVSNQDQGSTFLATLVVKTADRHATPPPQAIRRPAKDPLNILIVDDNAVNRRILEEMLASWGQSCHSAASGAQAIQQWDPANPYDLIITDHHMPEMDGIAMTRHFRALQAAANTRISLLSSEVHQPPEIRALFDEVGSKPIWPSAIHGILARLFPDTVAAATSTAVQPAEAGDAERLAKLKILVAEDNPNNQKVIRLLLSRLGIESELVANGQQAVAAASANTYDIILLDLQMPVMDGLEASRQIRALSLAQRPFIIALTANAFQENRDAANAAGMDDYLSKPITLARLREMLTKILRSAAPPA